jgi:hypothetical protein
MSGKFDALAAKVGSKNLAGWITQHNPKVHARATATRARKKTARAVMRAGKSEK